MSLGRRGLLACAGACLAADAPAGGDAVLSATYGCHLPAFAADAYVSRAEGARLAALQGVDLATHSASRYLDYAFAQTLGMLCVRFGVKPGFSYYREPADDPVNAYATEVSLPGYQDGSVLFGLTMLGRLLARPAHGDLAIVAVAAHEFGHIVALRRGLQHKLAPDPAQPFRAEQFADFMSGLFAGYRKQGDPDFHAEIFPLVWRDLAGTARGTHGTKEERGEAVREGFVAASATTSLDAAVEHGFRFATARPVEPG